MKKSTSEIFGDIASFFIVLAIVITIFFALFNGIRSSMKMIEAQDNDRINLSKDEYCIKYFSFYSVRSLPVYCLSVFTTNDKNN